MLFLCKQTKVKFTFSVTHQNSLCASLTSNKCVQCISFLIKHLQNQFLSISDLAFYIHVYLLASQSLLAHCCISWHAITSCRSVEKCEILWQDCVSRHPRAFPCALDKQNRDPLMEKTAASISQTPEVKSLKSKILH